MRVSIRPYRPDDFESLALLWRQARERAFPEFQRAKGHSFEEDQAYFQNVILVNDDVWVAEIAGLPAGFLAIAGDFIDQLFVAPAHQRQGVGRALLDYAKSLSPSGLRLYTFQANANGRAFYAKNGFRRLKFGNSSPPNPHRMWKISGMLSSTIPA